MLELVLSTLGLAVIPLGLALLEFWLLGGELGSEPPGIDTTEPAPSRSELAQAPLFVAGFMTTSSTDRFSCMCLYCSLAGLTEAAAGDRDHVL